MTIIGPLLILLLVLVGYLLSTYLVREAALVERVAYTLLFSMAAVPLVVIIICLAGSFYASAGLVGGVAGAFLMLLSRHGLSHVRGLRLGPVDWREAAVLASALAVAASAYLYYSNTAALLSMHSYLLTGKSSCFTMQLYSLVEGLNPAGDTTLIRKMYGIISTPGNALFTVGTVPLFGVHTFRWLYVLFGINLYLFCYLLVYRLTGRRLAAVAAALFAVANPYWLSVEILDRNSIALSLSAALIHALFFHKDRVLLHGLLLGLTAGTGLRFLPLTFGLSALVCHLDNRTRPRGYLIMAGAFAAVFAFNIPHLFHHGFHSLGESRPFLELLGAAVFGLQRSPFMPYPNFVYYPLTALSHFGAVAGGFMLLGAIRLVRRDRIRALALVLMMPVAYLVLAAQPDWIQVDKARIFISVLLPLLLVAGVGLAAVLTREKLVQNLALLGACIVAMMFLGAGLGRVGGTPDAGTYARKPMYQTESERYIRHYREHFAPVRLMPGYGRLFRKSDLSRKHREEQVIAHRLYGQSTDQRVAKNRWVRRWLKPDTLSLPSPATLSASHVNLKIDFERLVAGGKSPVSIPDKPGDLFVNLEKRKDLLNIYYKSMKVSWQSQPLPVMVLTKEPEILSLGELYIDLNAFISFGSDEDGFERINLISYMVSPGARAHARKTGMTALPQQDQTTTVTMRIPRDMKLVIRNWIVDGLKGVPHRVDAWKISVSEDGEPRVTFHPHEPESYF